MISIKKGDMFAKVYRLAISGRNTNPENYLFILCPKHRETLAVHHQLLSPEWTFICISAPVWWHFSVTMSKPPLLHWTGSKVASARLLSCILFTEQQKWSLIELQAWEFNFTKLELIHQHGTHEFYTVAKRLAYLTEIVKEGIFSSFIHQRMYLAKKYEI